MLTIVIVKPIQFTIVRAVPLSTDGAFLATKVEKRGESAMTTIPQKIRKAIKKKWDSALNIMPETRQQPQDRSNELNAIRLCPAVCAR